MIQLITIIHVLVAVCIIILVLMQHGKGADVGAAFGSGASQTMFGSAGSTPFMVKLTAVFATIFFITAVSLSFFVAKQAKQSTTNTIANSISQPIPVTTQPQPLPKQSGAKK